MAALLAVCTTPEYTGGGRVWYRQPNVLPPVYCQQPQSVLYKLLMANALLCLHWRSCVQSVITQWKV